MKPIEEIANGLASHIADAVNDQCRVPRQCLVDVAAALRAERERAERLKNYLVRQLRDANDSLTHFKVAAEQEHARAEKAEAERDAARTAYSELMRLRKQTSDALATARNRALEEAAECVKDCRQLEPECPHAARILSLRIPEAST